MARFCTLCSDRQTDPVDTACQIGEIASVKQGLDNRAMSCGITSTEEDACLTWCRSTKM